MDSSVERRKSFRLPFATKVICQANGEKYPGTIKDLSISGLFMETDDCPPLDAQCEIEIILEGENSRLMIDRLAGSVVHNHNGIGIHFDARLEWVAIVPVYFHKMQQQLSE